MSQRPIRKAVFPVAGLGTRLLPATKAIPKEMEIGMVVMASKDAREGPKAFLEKRAPNFTGE